MSEKLTAATATDAATEDKAALAGGPLQINLKRPINTPNGKVRTITLTREPTRRDLKAAQRITTDEEEQVWYMVCALSLEKLTIEDTEDLTLADVRQVMETFRTLSGLG